MESLRAPGHWSTIDYSWIFDEQDEYVLELHLEKQCRYTVLCNVSGDFNYDICVVN